MFKIIEYKDEDSKSAADIALKARLYVSGWALSKDLVEIRKGSVKAQVALAYDPSGAPVGVSVREGNWISVFVRKSHRRNGVGTLLVKALKNEHIRAGYGIVGSLSFWNKVGVEVSSV